MLGRRNARRAATRVGQDPREQDNMNVRLNGTMIKIDAGETLAALLRRHDIADDAAGIAVAVNDAVVPGREWAARTLENGDSVEVIRAVQGG